MILYSNDGCKIIAMKTNKPKFHKGDWDSVNVRIDEKDYDMNCSNKNNRSNFYFKYIDQWYKVPISTDHIDLFDKRPDLFTKQNNDNAHDD